VDGEQGSVDFGGYARFLTEMSEVGGQAVAEVDGGGGEIVALEPEALRDAGLGVKMRGELGFEPPGNAGRVRAGRLGKLGETGEASSGSTECAGDVE